MEVCTQHVNRGGNSIPDPHISLNTFPASKNQESEILNHLRSGNPIAFEELLDAFQTRIYRLALRYAKTTSDAEDITQETFVGVFKSLPGFKQQSSLSTWIYRIALNHCLEYKRRQRQDVLPLSEGDYLPTGKSSDNPVICAMRKETVDHIEAALDNLSSIHREVVILHELQELTYAEVASLLDIPIGTVKSRLYHAMRLLKQQLGSFMNTQETTDEN